MDVRPFTPDDEVSFFAMVGRNRDRFERCGLSSLPYAMRDVHDWLVKASQDHRCIVGLFQGAECIGVVGLEHVRVGRMAQPAVGVWYGLDLAWGRQGLASLGVESALLDYLCTWSLPQLVIHCRRTNRRSIKLAERLGFQRDESMDYLRVTGARSSQGMLGFSVATEAWLERSSTVAVEPPTVKRRPRRP